MNTLTTLNELIQARIELARPIGFVPTMGYLHQGHVSLAERARRECASVVASIFVNPTQFAPTEDLASYPRNLERDQLLLHAAGVDLVWVPTVEEMYPSGFQTWVNVESLTKPLEGKMRPTHFQGVTTVVAKLFNAVQPDRAYFGQKDAQQAAVIKQMVRDLNYPIEVVVCPIVREPDGLALSSRNTYLSPEQRNAATILYRALKTAQQDYFQGERDAGKLRHRVEEMIAAEPLASLQYVSLADPDTLQELDSVREKALLSLAVHFGKTRLIDNLILGE